MCWRCASAWPARPWPAQEVQGGRVGHRPNYGPRPDFGRAPTFTLFGLVRARRPVTDLGPYRYSVGWLLGQRARRG